jgi:glycosyl transferase family 25
VNLDHIYVINLPEAGERRQWMLWQLDKAALGPYTVWNATRGKDLPRETVLQLVDTAGFERRYGRRISPGEIGCAVSHLAAYGDMLEKGHRYGLVLEDDALLSPRLGTVLPGLGRFFERTAPTVLLLTALRRYRRRPRTEVGRGLYVVKVESAWRGHGYMLNIQAAGRIAALQAPIRFLADDWKGLSAAAGLEIWGLNHYMIGLSALSGESSLEEGRLECGPRWQSAGERPNGAFDMKAIRERCLRAMGFTKRQPHPW